MLSLPIPRPRTHHERRRKGFTIIESLVLLGILAVLTMILIALARKHFIEPKPLDPIPETAPASEPATPTATTDEEKTEPKKPEPAAP